MEKVIIIGVGGHGRVVIDASFRNLDIEFIGFLDDGDENEVLGLKKLGSIGDIEKFRNYKFHIAIGNNNLRKELGERIGRENLITLVHPTAYLSKDVVIGKGCYIGANVVINSKSIIEDLVIVNTGSIVEHDCILKNCAHLSYGVLLGSFAKIEKSIYIEMGKIIKRGEVVKEELR